ncbi:MAG: aspartyl/asparaginyl beta-hydroxylase domain-containing protein, partial [Bacteroidia bacterium]|nr:aspartyl/asparaginyl beta-hydroxylase domain-containing protein [Bacteroidia bacterium]
MTTKLWFSILSKDARYISDEPNFILPETLEWTKNSEYVASIIKEELEDYLKNNDLQSYFNTTMSDDVRKWKTISLKWWGLEFYSRQRHFPKTTQFINSIPNLISASFNLLEANSSIYPHCGDTNGIYRCHLGLIIPAGLPECGFRVENEKREWKEGQWLIFIDAKEHEAWNKSEKNRFILLIDIIRPDYIKYKSQIVLISLTGLFLQRMAEVFKILYR